MRIKPVRIITVVMISVVVLLAAMVLAISPITKYVIEKNSEQWTGRKITMNHLFINLWKWNVTVKDLKVFENKSQKVFFSADKIFTDIDMWPAIKGEYKINTIKISNPKVVIDQNGSHFNYDDLVTRFTAVDTTVKEPVKPSEPVKYRLERMEITGGTITYHDKVLNHEIVLQNFNLGCPLLVWNSADVKAATTFSFKSGGKVDARLALNLDSLSYMLHGKIDKFDLQVLYPYMKDYMVTSYAGGLLSSDLVVKGDFDVPSAIAVKGNVNLADFRIDDKAKNTVAAWKNFSIDIDSLDVAANIYNFGLISLNDPYLLFEYYDKSNNFTQLMVPTETVANADTSVSVDEIDYSNPFTIMADYVKEISRDYIISNYTANNVVMHNGHIVYKDYTLEDKFVYDLENLELNSGRISSKSDSVTFDMSCLSNRSGIINAHLAFDPRDYMNMSINYSIAKMRISDFNPYSKFYVAHAFVEGLLFYTSTNTIHNGQLKSTNLMSIKKIEVSRKLKGGLMEVPLRLAIAILRDRKGNIELDIPVEGDLKDPKYKLGKLIWQVVKNLIVKAATAPFTLIAKAFGTNEDEIKTIRFDYLQQSFDSHQMKSLDMLGKVMEDKPDLNVALVQVCSRENEKEQLALERAKEAYYLKQILKSPKDSLDINDLKAVANIMNKDSLFNIWLNQQLLPADISVLPIQVKCRKYIGEAQLDLLINKLFDIRNKWVMDYLVNEKKVDSTRVKITNTLDEKSAQFESTPRYTVAFVVDE